MKKGVLKTIFLCLMIAVILFFGMEIYKEFMANHTYYYDMFGAEKNRYVVIAAMISSLVPLVYILFKNKKFSVGIFSIFLFGGALLFGYINLIIKDSIITPTGIIPYFVNELILFSFGGLFLVGTLAFGTWLSKLIFNFREYRLQEMFLNFGIGLGGLLILWQTLIGFGLFYSWICWLIFLGILFLVIYERRSLKEYGVVLSNIFNSINDRSSKNRWKYLLIILILFSFVYYFYGFQLSFIPYSTAWDANHAYMYIPKVIAENHGLIWGNVGAANSMSYLWYAFISFWFGIGSVFSKGWLAPDTIAVAMNFLSGPLCLIFGLGLLNEVLDFFLPKNDDKKDAIRGVSFAGGWATLLLWLTSGMGAFLVFVDNKTDLGVMAITILSILSGFIFIRYISDRNHKGLDKESVKYLIISGILFALACMCKPIAFIDVAIFGVLLCALWLNSFTGLGVGIMGLGFMGIMKPLSAAQFMTESLGKYLIIIGFIIALFGIVMMFTRNNNELSKKRTLFSYILIWACSLVGSLIVFKGPWLAYYEIKFSNDFSIGNWGKNLIMSYDNSDKSDFDGGKRILLATTADVSDLEYQNQIDNEVLSNLDVIDDSGDVETSFEQCLSTKYSDDELNEGLKDAPVGNEDFGRYVGYGWKEFNNSNRLSYKLLRLFYPKNNTCYGVNSDAKVLCDHMSAIERGDVDVLNNLDLTEGSPAYQILESGLIAYSENPDTLMDLVSDLKTYYQDHVIYTESGKLYIPYRYVVPLNITFNWSLQNLSSYYTDIGFVRIFVFLFLIFSFIYSIIRKNNKLFALSMATVIGWAIWRVIGSAILWYGVGLLMWTSLVMAIYINDLLNDDSEGVDILGILAVGLFGVFVLMQFFFNFIRIASQGSSGPFLWYKQYAGQEQIFHDDLSYETVEKFGYSQKDVFDLQFPQYNRFINYVKNRKDEDGVLIAGTYMQYFLDNQKNIKFDGSLDRFWEQGSDGDTCKMYHRLKNANIKYLVIDPNIASIVMGDGNKSLFYRFFAKTNDDGKIIEKGALMMLSELIDQGYAKLLYSNNLGATYGFTLSDDDLMAIFGEMDKESLIYLRAQLAAARYMDNVNDLAYGIINILASRLSIGEAIQDVADVYGKEIDFGKIYNAMDVYLRNRNSFPQMVSTLTQDERIILIQYINLYYSQDFNTILSNSIAGGSQLIVVELL